MNTHKPMGSDGMNPKVQHPYLEIGDMGLMDGLFGGIGQMVTIRESWSTAQCPHADQ